MGISPCKSIEPLPQGRTFNADAFSDVDKNIFLGNEFMQQKNENDGESKLNVQPFFTDFLFKQLEEEKGDKIKARHFSKWFDMSVKSSKLILSNVNVETVVNSLQKSMAKNMKNNKKENYIPGLNQEISYTEQGLRNYFSENPIHFESRVQKAPPAIFRWLSWVIMSGVPINRPSVYYENLLTYSLPPEIESKINQDLYASFKENNEKAAEMKLSAFRILKAIAVLDKKMSYAQGLHYFVLFLLDISNRNEVDVFYMMMTLFSNTFVNKFGMRGLFLEDDSQLLNLCEQIFNEQLELENREVKEHITEKGLLGSSWIRNWIKFGYIGLFPNEILLRVWDYYMIYGLSFLINFALALVDVMKADLLEISEVKEMEQYFLLLNPNIPSNFSDQDKEIHYDIDSVLANAASRYKKNTESLALIDGFFYQKEADFKYPFKKIRPKSIGGDNKYNADISVSEDFTPLNKNAEIHNKSIEIPIANNDFNYNLSNNNENNNNFRPENNMQNMPNMQNYQQNNQQNFDQNFSSQYLNDLNAPLNNDNDQSYEDIEDENFHNNENSHIQDMLKKSQMQVGANKDSAVF